MKNEENLKNFLEDLEKRNLPEQDKVAFRNVAIKGLSQDLPAFSFLLDNLDALLERVESSKGGN